MTRRELIQIDANPKYDDRCLTMPYALAGQTYQTKANVTQRCRDILSATPNGGLVGFDDSAFLLDLFSYHTEWSSKCGPGIASMTTMTTDHGTRCFRLHRVDGEIIDISFMHAIKHLPTKRSKDLLPQPLIDFKNGARMAIKDQIETFRQANQFAWTANMHVDHVYPRTFDALLFGFCMEYGVNPLHVEVIELNQCIHHIIDDATRESWQRYHLQWANLAMLSGADNLKAPKSKIAWERTWSHDNGVPSSQMVDAYTRNCPSCGQAFQVDDYDDPDGNFVWGQFEGPCCFADTPNQIV